MGTPVWGTGFEVQHGGITLGRSSLRELQRGELALGLWRGGLALGSGNGVGVGGGEGSSLGGSTAGIGVGEAQQWGLALGVGICGV